MHCKEKYKLPDLKSFEKMVDGIWQREYYTNQGPLAVELESKIEKFLTLMKTFGVIDLTRTGKVAMPRK